MVMTWFIGVNGMNIAFSTAARLRTGTEPDLSALAREISTMADVVEYGALCGLRATFDHARVMFPLAVGELILSGLLVVASGLAMGGRRGSRALALQAILANAVLAAVAFALTPFIRSARIDGMLHALDALALPPEQREALAHATVYQWGLRLQLVFHLGALALGALALTRDRTKTFFEAVARATDNADPS
jgi:hypothetical protein